MTREVDLLEHYYGGVPRPIDTANCSNHQHRTQAAGTGLPDWWRVDRAAGT